MPLNMLKFGSANNFSGNIGEWALKEIVNDHATKPTQRQPAICYMQVFMQCYQIPHD